MVDSSVVAASGAGTDIDDSTSTDISTNTDSGPSTNGGARTGSADGDVPATAAARTAACRCAGL